MTLEQRWGISWWDALLLASAAASKCTHFLTDEAQPAAVIEGIQIVDPFTASPEDILGAGA